MEESRGAVLLVEDSRIYLCKITKFLHDAGFEVVQASDGEEAVVLLEGDKQAFTAIVTDLTMPKFGGAGIAELNRSRYRLPIVVITGTGDSRTSLELLEFGVRDFVLKPFDEKIFIQVLKNAISRNSTIQGLSGVEQYDGNVGQITISAKKKNLTHASGWITKKLEGSLDRGEVGVMVGYLGEFLQNAYEHGSLNITEKTKCRLLNDGVYEMELTKREKYCGASIKVELSILDGEVAVKITDEGVGFAFHKYLNFTQRDILERLSKPNGRGIYMAKSYFDLVKYDSGGSSVLVTKTLH